MDSLRGIPVEYKLDAYNMPRTGPTLCHPKIGYVDLSVTPLSTHMLPIHRWSTLMEITPTLPQIPDAKLTVTSKFNSYNCDMSFVKNAKVQSLTSDNTRCLLNISWRHFVSTLTSLAAPKANLIPCCNKNLIHKNTFRPSPSLFLYHSTFIYP